MVTLETQIKYSLHYFLTRVFYRTWKLWYPITIVADNLDAGFNLESQNSMSIFHVEDRIQHSYDYYWYFFSDLACNSLTVYLFTLSTYNVI